MQHSPDASAVYLLLLLVERRLPLSFFVTKNDTAIDALQPTACIHCRNCWSACCFAACFPTACCCMPLLLESSGWVVQKHQPSGWQEWHRCWACCSWQALHQLVLDCSRREGTADEELAQSRSLLQ